MTARHAVRCHGVVKLFEVERLGVHRRPAWSVQLPCLDLGPGEVAALYGPSGSGKSTLLAACFGLVDETAVVEGAVRWRGTDLVAADDARRRHVLRSEITFLMQDAANSLDPLERVGSQVSSATGRSHDDAVAALGELGLRDPEGVCRRFPHEISGGQAQCALLAIAFLRSPELVVADEPSAHLDGTTYTEHVEHLRALLARGSAVLVATHDQRLLRDLGARVFSQQGGAFVPGAASGPAWPRRRGGVEIGVVPLLTARGVTVKNGPVTVLEDVDFDVRRGEVVAIVGASGAGKTTLGRVLAGHRRPDRGTVDRPSRVGAVQLVCQDAQASLTPRRTIRSLVEEARSPFVDTASVARELNLADGVLDRSVHELSGGERRRAALLRAIAVHPDVVVLDEPTAGLDRGSALAVIDLLLAMQRQRGLAIVVVTHDVDLAEAIADRVVVVSGGRSSR